MITSLQNPRVQKAARLRQRRQREKQVRFLIDGARELERAIAAGIVVEEVFLCETLCERPESRRIVEQAEARSLRIVPVSESVFGKLAFGQRAEGVLGVAVTPQRGLADLKLPHNPLVAVLEGVEKPGNVGAVIRSADGAGVSALIVADAGTDLYNPNAIRASLGAIFSLPVAVASAEETLAWIRAQGLRLYAARVDAAIDYTQADFTQPAAIVLGSEAAGLTPIWSCDDAVSIALPMRGMADSLNVATTAAVLFYEALRQRAAMPLT